MITPYTAQQPISDYGLRFAGLKFSAALAAATDTSLTIPGITQYYEAIIISNVETWVAINQAAAAPAGAAFASTTSELVPAGKRIARQVKASDVLHFFSTPGGDVNVLLYALWSPN